MWRSQAHPQMEKGGDSGGPLVNTQKSPLSIIKLVEQGNEHLGKKSKVVVEVLGSS